MKDLGRWLKLKCRLKILLSKALIEFAFDIQRDWLIVAKFSTPIKLKEDMSFVLCKSAVYATGCCLPYVLIPSPLPSWHKISVVASLGALPLPCCLLFVVSDQAPVVKDKQAWLPLSLASPQEENSEKSNVKCACSVLRRLCSHFILLQNDCCWWRAMENQDQGLFSISSSCLHTSGTVLIVISSTLLLCLQASFERCFLFCSFLQQAPAFLEVAAGALSQGVGMPASASIHFCFHYAGFLQSFKLILMPPSISRPIKRSQLCLPWWAGTCSGIRRMLAWWCWGYPFPLLASSQFLAPSSGKHPDLSWQL